MSLGLMALIVAGGLGSTGCKFSKKKLEPSKKEKTSAKKQVNPTPKPPPSLSVEARNGDLVKYFHSSSSSTAEHKFFLDPCSPVELRIGGSASPTLRRLSISGSGKKYCQSDSGETLQTFHFGTVSEEYNSSEFESFERELDLSSATACPQGRLSAYDVWWLVEAEDSTGEVIEMKVHAYVDVITSSWIQVPGVGSKGDGAGMAAMNLNANSRPDLVLMAYDDPSGQNDFRYRVARDLGPSGHHSSYGSWWPVDGVGKGGDGAGAALYDLDGSGRPELILMAYDAPSGGNSFRYRVGRNLNGSGEATSWGPWQPVEGVGNSGEGAGMDLAQIDADPRPEMVLMAYDAPSGPNSFRYRVGWNLGANGAASSWSSWIQVAGVGSRGDGAGLTLEDLNGNGRPEMILMAYDDPNGQNDFRYRVGWDVKTNGKASSWSGWREVTGVGKWAEGAGVAFTMLPGNRLHQLVLMAYDAGSKFRYRVLTWLDCGP